MKKVSTYTIFISNPNDVSEERAIVENAIERISKTYSEEGIAFDIIHSGKIASSFGSTPQNIINEETDDYDVYIGLMGSTFGSKTEKYGSGTEEEFNIALENSKKNNNTPHVSFLFKDEDISIATLSDEAIDQFKLVRDFKSRISKSGYYQKFSDNDELVQQIDSILQGVVKKYRGEASQKAHQSEMLVESPIKDVFVIDSEFYSSVLNSVGAELTNNKKSSILLDDIYVPLDVSIMSYDSDRDEELLSDEAISSSCLTDYQSTSNTKVILAGDENAGKTSLIKKLFLNYHSNGIVPVIINGEDIKTVKTNDITKKIEKNFIDQYSSDALPAYKKLSNDNKILIIDDLDNSSLNEKYLFKILQNLENVFSHVFVTVDELFLLNANISNAGVLSNISNFNKYKLRDVGFQLRDDIVQRWISAGREHEIQEEELYALTETYRGLIDKIIGANFVPKKPFVILVLLQAIQGGTSNELAQGSYVRYYKFLIDSVLLTAVPQNKIDIYYGFLPELANSSSKEAGKIVSDEILDTLIDSFGEKKGFHRGLLDDLKNNLIRLGIIHRCHDGYKFKHNYCYYYFLAQHIKNNLHDEKTRDRVKNICLNLHVKDNSNTIIFLSYHTDDNIIIDSIEDVTKDLFNDVDIFDFNDDSTKKLNSLVSEASETLIEDKRDKKERKDLLKKRDDLETTNDNEPDIELQQVYSTVNKINIAFKSIEIIGQLLKNHYATLDAEPKRQLYEKAVNLGLRTLNVFVQNVTDDPEPLLDYLKKKGEEVDKEKQKKKAVFGFANMVVFGVIKNVSQATGAYELSQTYEDVISKQDLLAYDMIHLSTKLDFFNDFPMEDIKAIVPSLGNNHLAMSTLRSLAQHRLYMRPLDDFKTRQKICDSVGIKINKQLTIEKKGKNAA